MTPRRPDRTTRRRVVVVVAAVLAVTLLVAGCSDGGRGAEEEVVVLAAASLTDAFADLAEQFERANPGITVTLSFAGSQSLATQIVQGAPADVFASANGAQMDVVAAEGLLADERRIIAKNELAIAVAANNPFGIGRLADLADPDVVLVLASPEVPAGAFAAEALAAAGVTVTPSSLEVDVRSALTKVEQGEADAAIVYASDVATAGDAVLGIAIPAEHNVVAEYPIAVLDAAPNPAGARAFVDLVLSEAGQQALIDRGFVSPVQQRRPAASGG